MHTDDNSNSLRIYVVDDSPLIRRRVAEMVEQCHATLAGQAGSVDAAVREIQELRPDLVILDMQLSDGSGFDVLRALEGKTPATEYCMFSNFAADPYRYMARQLGARAFFDKSREFGCLRDAVAQRVAARH